MPLHPGTRVGPYEIVAPLGVGGMGEVYRAHDPRLGRDVAIKALPATIAEHPEVRSRFQREAKILASLNHPNIAALYGLEESARTPYLVLELVEGETLAARLAASALAMPAALALGVQIAGAIEAAHERGVVHRDLKPGNVMITPSGNAKVLDFGLAKSDPSPSPTLAESAAATAAGLSESTQRSVERALTERDPLLVWGRRSPFWDAVRAHPRTAEALNTIPWS